MVAPMCLVGQGTIALANREVGLFDYPISDCRGPLSGAGWTAQLSWGPLGTPEADLQPLLPTAGFSTKYAGYLIPVTVAVEGAGWEVTVQLRVWDNEGGTITQYQDALVRAATPPFGISPGGWGSPPTLPAALTPLGDLPLLVVNSPGCEPVTNTCCYAVGFSLANLVVQEDRKSVRLTVARNRLADATEAPGPEDTACYVLEDVTAHSGEDYLAGSGMVDFNSPSSGWVDVQLMDNPTWNGTREFRVRLFDPAEGVALGRNATTTVTITDDDTVLGPQRGVNGGIRTIVPAAESGWFIGGDFTMVDDYLRGGVALLESDGVIDLDFDPGMGADGSVYCVLCQPDGKVLIGGGFSSFGDTGRSLLVRLDPTGASDPGFTPDIGSDAIPRGDPPRAVRHVVSQPDGKLLVAGAELSSGAVARAGVIRLNDDGSLDPSFVPAPGLTNATILALQPDGRVLVGADRDYGEGFLVRLASDGSLDPEFNADLKAIQSRAVRGARTLEVLPDGRILVGGMGVYSGISLGLLVLNSNGGPAATQVSLSIVGDPINTGGVSGMARQENGKLLITGGFSGKWMSYGGVVRVHADLRQDYAFGPKQTILDDWMNLHLVAVQKDGIIGGVTAPYRSNRLVLFRENGNPVQDLHFTGVATLPDGEVHLALRGTSTWTGYLQMSTDLMHWESISSDLATQGWVSKDTTATNSPRRFYRAARSR